MLLALPLCASADPDLEGVWMLDGSFGNLGFLLDAPTEEWLIEMLARIALERQGFDLDALQPGLFVRLKGRPGYRANTMYFEEAELPDGRILTSPGPIR